MQYIDLLARYDPSQLLSFLKKKAEHYNEQVVLDVIEKSSSTLLIPSIAYLLERLGKYTETFDLLLKSMEQWASLDQLYQITLDCIHFCQRTTTKLKNKQEREDLWLKFLQTILEISTQSLDHEQSGAFRRIYGEILNSMIGYVTLPSILELIMGTEVVDRTDEPRKRSDTNTRTTLEIRQLIQSMLENCSFELRLLETTRRLLQRDLNDDIEQMCTIINRSVPIRMNQCTFCQKSFHQSNQQVNKLIVFACRHVFHLSCLKDLQTDQSNHNFCPHCHSQQSSMPSPSLSTTSSTTAPPLARRLTSVHSDQNEKQIALANIQQRVISTILDRKRLNMHRLQQSDEQSSTKSSISNMQNEDNWKEYLSFS